MYIQGKNVILRSKKMEDVNNDFSWRTNEELSRLDATTPINLSIGEFRRYSKQEIDFPSPSSVRLAIDTIDGKHIGNIMYYDIDIRKDEFTNDLLIIIRVNHSENAKRIKGYVLFLS